MDAIHNLLMGFGVALTWSNLAYCLMGAFIGTLVGVLPGIGPITTIAMLLPFTLKLPAVASLIMLAGIYYGAHHAGSTTAIMLNMPGEPTSIVICFDGHPMAKKGRAGVALFVAAVGSFFAGCVGVAIIAAFSPPLAAWAVNVDSASYASMIVFALVTAASLDTRSAINTFAMAVLGVLLGSVGTDVNSSVWRFTFGSPNLADGLDFVAVATGLFAFAEVISHAGSGQHDITLKSRINSLLPTRDDVARMWKPILRGTGIGAFFGILPGIGPLISAYASYAAEKRLSKTPARFGEGAVEGVAGPEAANNAAAITHFIPMLSLGIPAGAAMALMLSAMLIQGITPGPQVMTSHPDLFWGLIASMLVGNVMLLILNLPMVGLWVKLLQMPYRLLYPGILLFCAIGVYSVSNKVFDVFLAAGFGVLGFVFKKLGCSPGPLVLGLILGAKLEEETRRTLLLSHGDPTVFFTQPVSLAFLILAVVTMLAFSIPRRRAKADD